MSYTNLGTCHRQRKRNKIRTVCQQYVSKYVMFRIYDMFDVDIWIHPTSRPFLRRKRDLYALDQQPELAAHFSC